MIDIKKWVKEYLIRAKDLFGEDWFLWGFRGAMGEVRLRKIAI